MRVSARCDYACRALFELALNWPNKIPVRINKISEKQGMPTKYLVHILLHLKRTGLVASIRGKKGGYNLAIAPDKITLGEVVRQMGGPLLPMAESVARKGATFSTIWNEVEKAIARVLDKITFEDIVDKSKSTSGTFSYHI